MRQLVLSAVCPPGIEPGSLGFQPSAVTRSAGDTGTSGRIRTDTPRLRRPGPVLRLTCVVENLGFEPSGAALQGLPAFPRAFPMWWTLCRKLPRSGCPPTRVTPPGSSTVAPPEGIEPSAPPRQGGMLATTPRGHGPDPRNRTSCAYATGLQPAVRPSDLIGWHRDKESNPTSWLWRPLRPTAFPMSAGALPRWGPLSGR